MAHALSLHRNIERFQAPLIPDEIISPCGQRTLFCDKPPNMDKPVVIPKIVPEELHDLWVSLQETQRTFLLQFIDDPEHFISLLKMNIPIEQEARESAKKIHKVAATSPEQQSFYGFFPTELTRTTPFFPMSREEMKNRPYIKDLLIADHSWGTILYSGPKLSVYEEDLLMYLLAAINEANQSYLDHYEGKRTYTYRGSLHKVLHVKNTDRVIGHKDYQAALSSFKLMTNARIDLTTHTTGPGGKKIPKKTTFTNLVIGGEYDHETGDFVCTVNPFFAEAYEAGQITWMDVKMRARIKSPTGKAIYRFMQSHRENQWHGPITTLAQSLNLDPNQPAAKHREKLKVAISELIELDFLLPGSGYDLKTVTLLRNPKPPAEKNAIASKRAKKQLVSK